MRRLRILLILVLTAILSDDERIPLPSVNGNRYWTIDNQLKKEDRPYTIPPDVTPGGDAPSYRSTTSKLLTPHLRDMQRMCDGQCFYAPSECDNKAWNCSLIASVAMHNEDKQGLLYCDYFGKNESLRESFCFNSEAQKAYRSVSGAGKPELGKPDRFYTITLHRSMLGRREGDPPLHTCANRWNILTGRRCRRTEFVAISFVNKNGNDKKLDAEDVWYVCIVDENSRKRITMWSSITEDDSAQPDQILETKPHVEAGMGVVFSKITWDDDIASMGCQFVIQESNMTIADPPKNAAFFGTFDHRPITVKLAAGYVQRDPKNLDNVRRPFYKNEAEDHAYYLVYSGDEIKPTNQLKFEKLEVKLKNASVNWELDVKAENISNIRIEDILKKCDNPQEFPLLYIACYPPSTMQNCAHTGRCPVMFIVELNKTDTSFKTIKAHLYGLLPSHNFVRKGRRPQGAISVGFSEDNKMGRDLVITCHADGSANINVVVSVNFMYSNIYPGKIDLSNLVWNTEAYGTAETGKLLCTWEMNTSMVVNMFEYEPVYREAIYPGESEKLEFDFIEKKVHLLLSSSNRNYPKGVIVKHNFAQVLDNLFSKDLFFHKAGDATRNLPFLTNFAILIVILFLIV